MVDREQWKPPEPYVEPSPRWVRVRAGDALVADSRRALVMSWYGPGRLPTYCLPPEDVRTDLLRPSDQAAREPFMVGHDVVTGDAVITNAASWFRSPPSPFEALDGYWTFTWDDGLSWFEEALEVHVHAKDPHKRVDAVPSERHVRVEIDGQLIAETRRPLALFETPLPTRWYIPREDVRQDVLVPTSTVTQCPYKGTARYWSVRVGDTVHDDLAWSYEQPIPENPRIKDLIAFFNERVDLYVDGEHQERAVTPWSR